MEIIQSFSLSKLIMAIVTLLATSTIAGAIGFGLIRGAIMAGWKPGRTNVVLVNNDREQPDITRITYTGGVDPFTIEVSPNKTVSKTSN